MADFTTSIIIEGPVEEVFRYVSSMENVAEYLPPVINMEKLTDGETGVGSKFRETRWVRKSEVHSDVEITEFEPYKNFATRSNSNGLIIIYEYKFDEIVEGTQVQLNAHIKTTGLKMRLARGYLVKMVKDEDGGQLQLLKEALETNK